MLISHHTKVAVRNTVRHGTTASIKLLGLSVGIACCIVAIAFVRYHASWDTFHRESYSIFRVLLETEESDVYDRTNRPLGPALVEAFPEVESVVWTNRVTAQALPSEGRFSSHMAITDPWILKIFDYHLIAGDPETALRQPFSVVLIESTTIRWRGSTVQALSPVHPGPCHDTKLTLCSPNRLTSL